MNLMSEGMHPGFALVTKKTWKYKKKVLTTKTTQNAFTAGSHYYNDTIQNIYNNLKVSV